MIAWSAAVVVPFATLAALSPEVEPVALLFIALFFVVALLDSLLGMGCLDGIAVEMPAITRLAKDRDGGIDIQIVNQKGQSRLVRLGLPFPAEIHSPQEDQTILLPAAAPRARFTWPCTPRKRGSYPLSECHLEGASPLGFWAVRSVTPMRSEVRVYPSLLTERKSVAAIFLHRGQFGLHAQRQVGKGRDFEKLREYIPGDSIDDVHWKATAKRARPVTKVFQIERTQEVYVIIDSSRLSARAVATGCPQDSRQPGLQPAPAVASRVTLLERYITAGLVLGLAAEQQGDLFGLLTFSDRVDHFVRARNGKAHYSACRDAIYGLQPSRVTPDFDELCAFIRLRLRRRALLVFLTSLDDPVLAESFVRNMDLIRRQHLILVNMMQAPEVHPLFTNPAVAGVDDLYRELGGHLLWSNLRELEKVLQRRGVRFSLLPNEKLTAQLVTQYLTVKRRQML